MPKVKVMMFGHNFLSQDVSEETGRRLVEVIHPNFPNSSVELIGVSRKTVDDIIFRNGKWVWRSEWGKD